MPDVQIHLPVSGMSKESVLSQMESVRDSDLHWREGKVFSLVFFAGQEASDLLKETHSPFFSENGLNPTAFPSLGRFETEVVAMSTSLLGGDTQVVGNMTSGGTESILMAVFTAREWARKNKPQVEVPEIVLPQSAHLAFDKAAHYFNVKSVHVPLGSVFRVDVTAMPKAITPNTILMVGSAPTYPHGEIDPITKLAFIAEERGILFHVDACMGGYMLTFARQFGHPVPDFDFGLPGVTSISADPQKYGYAAKGASVILYRNASIRRHQLFAHINWPGGNYASPTMAGTRPGGAIAAVWAIMNHLGEDGYLKITRRVMEAVTRIRQEVDAIEGIDILGEPVMSFLALGSESVDIYEVGDEMGLRGWHLDRQHFPASLHLTVKYAHVDGVEEFLRDLGDSAAAARRVNMHRKSIKFVLSMARIAARLLSQQVVSRLTALATSLVGPKGTAMPKRSTQMYGMIGSLPNRGDLQDVVLDLIEQFTKPQDEPGK